MVELATDPFTNTLIGICTNPITVPVTVKVAEPLLNGPKVALTPAGSGVPTARLSPASTGLTVIVVLVEPLPVNNCKGLDAEPLLPVPEGAAKTWVTASDTAPKTGPIVP